MTDALEKFTTEQLQAELLRRQKPEYETYYCSKCGLPEEEDFNGILVDVRVVIADGEEGYANITQLVCSNCLGKMIVDLTALGFKDHRHGSINYLEDEDCPGVYENCPTPTTYGPIVVQPDGPVPWHN